MEDETLQQFQMMTPTKSQVFESGWVMIMNTKKRTYQRPFTIAVCVILVGNLGPLPSPDKKIE